MIKQMIVFFSFIPIVCTGQVYWSESSNNLTHGKLGIGMSSPSYDIDIWRDDWVAGVKIVNVNWAGRSLILLGQQGSNSKYGYIGHHSQAHDAGLGYTQTFKPSSTVIVGSDANGLGLVSKSDMRFSSGGEDDTKLRMILASNGNLGIGTLQPFSKLHVSGGIFANGVRTNAVFDGELQNSGNVNLIGSEAYWALRTALDNSYNLDVYSGGQEKVAMTVLQNGSVGIGTTSPDQKLTVKGIIHTEEVRVDMTVPGPDYVFEPDYKLTPLDEVEAYIRENKHLPEVPSAKEMEEEGLNLKEMNLLLLKKVEELTLHLIEQQKQIDSQNSEIKKLRRPRS